MTLPLREQIARRIASIKWPGLADPLNETVADKEIDSAQGNMATWGDVADEVIRQMEWASQEAFNRTITEPIAIDQNKFPGMNGVRILGKRDLTLAPKDWSPK